MVEGLSGEFIGDLDSTMGQFVSWVCNFALVRIFGISQTISLVLIQKILTNTKQAKRSFFIQSHTAITSIVLCESWNQMRI